MDSLLDIFNKDSSWAWKLPLIVVSFVIFLIVVTCTTIKICTNRTRRLMIQHVREQNEEEIRMAMYNTIATTESDLSPRDDLLSPRIISDEDDDDDES